MASDFVFSYFSERLREYLDDSHQAEYLIRYLADLDAKTCVLEDKYVDKDYLIDYQKFYSRSFDEAKRFTERIHFFVEDFSTTKFEESLENNDIEYLRKSYLGFVVIRPIKGSDRKRLIGRTILNAYPDEKGSEKRVFIRGNYDVSLFGIPLSVSSLPFQVQDQGVSACATIALWTALHPLADTYGIQRLFPAEITELSTSFPSEYRNFPSSGLNWGQMINCVKSMELDVETIIYPKIRLPFARIYPRYLAIKERVIKDYGDDLDFELYLTTIRKYKEFLLESTIKEKRKILIKSLPRFLWVLRAYYEGKPLKDIVFDGTAIYPKQISSIDFRI